MTVARYPVTQGSATLIPWDGPTSAEAEKQQAEYIQRCRSSGQPLDPHRIGPLPFCRDAPRWTPYEIVRTVLMLAVAVLRLLGMIWALATAVVMCYICGIGHKVGEPLTGWRYAVLSRTSPAMSRAILFFAGFWHITVNGRENIPPRGHPQRPPIVVMNHTGYFDTLIGMWLVYPGYAAKHEVRDMPGIGYTVALQGGIFVERHKDPVERRRLGKKVLDQLAAHARERNVWTQQRLIFPEGTTTNGRFMLPFRQGAFAGGAPVQPIVFRYRNKGESPTWEAIGAATHLFRMMTQISNYMQVDILPVYEPSRQEQADTLLFAENVRRVMAKALDIPLGNMTTTSWQDKYLYQKLVQEHSLSPEQYLDAAANLQKEKETQRVRAYGSPRRASSPRAPTQQQQPRDGLRHRSGVGAS